MKTNFDLLKNGNNMRKTDHNKVVINVEDFAKLSSSQICEILDKNRNYYIEGDMPGVDRCIMVDINKNKQK